MPLTRYLSGKAVAEKNHEGIYFKVIMSTKVFVLICLLVCSIITLTIEGKILITVNQAPDFNLQRRRSSVGANRCTDDPAPLKKRQKKNTLMTEIVSLIYSKSITSRAKREFLNR